VSPKFRQRLGGRNRRQSVVEVSRKCRQSVAKVSRKCRESVAKVSRKCRQSVAKVSPKCRRSVARVSRKCRESVAKVSPKCRQSLARCSRSSRRRQMVAKTSLHIHWMVGGATWAPFAGGGQVITSRGTNSRVGGQKIRHFRDVQQHLLLAPGRHCCFLILLRSKYDTFTRQPPHSHFYEIAKSINCVCLGRVPKFDLW
jgi:hypothetical protein